MTERLRWNQCRYSPGDEGHYESYFQRANHPHLPQAFWIRYTIFSPKRGSGGAPLGELWGIFFDGDTQEVVAVRETRPLDACRFSKTALDVQIGDAVLDNQTLSGTAASRGNEISWSLDYDGGGEPLLLLPEKLYAGGFPKAKALVGSPGARYRGHIDVNGRRVEIDDWVGSQNHNWGIRHTDHYAWGQVAGFDNNPEAFLEVSTARIKLGPIWSPFLTLVVLRVDGQEFRLNSIPQALKAKGRFRYFDWSFDSRTRDVSIKGRIHAPKSAFTALTYLNPPGGEKTCLNSKIASCEITLQRAGEASRTFRTSHRAAFEILTDDHHGHGVARGG